jgi:HEAT repeat protein
VTARFVRKRDSKARCAREAYRALHFADMKLVSFPVWKVHCLLWGMSVNFLQWFFKPNIEKLQSRRDVQSLIMALLFKEPVVRRAAAEALGKIGDPCAVDSLLKALKDDNQNVRTEAASALGKIADPRSAEPLIKVLDHKDNQLRHKAAEALLRICASSIEPLITALKDNTIKSKACCEVAAVLGQIGDARAVESLIAALKHHHRNVRQAAVQALGEIAAPRAVEPLIEALDQEDTFSCLVTAEALRKIGDPRAVELLIRALDDGDCDVAWRAASALGKIRDPRAVEPLIKALDQGDTFLCLVATEALGEIGDPSAVEPLMALHRTASDHSVRDQANKALKRCGCQDNRALTDELCEIKKLLDHSLDANVFVRSAESLGFHVLGERPWGLPMESRKGRLMLTVLESIHPTDIAGITYSGKGAEHSITLVEEGKRKY